ncbi:MAG: aminotransferase class V-fold PLP-dependent enzyme [Microthrixaceae bacterium]|nr:aminotransferase class V-fold PLP-dependent enzyme [Microthrixaceae bacterium]
MSERALSVLEPPSLDLHSALWTGPDSYEVAPGATRFEQFEANVAARLGLGVACRYALGLGVERTWARIRGLAERLREGLGGIERVSVHDKGVVRGGTVTFTVDGETARQVSGRLRSAGINTSVTAQSSAVFDLPERGLDDVVRASVHYYNTESEVDRLIAEVADPSG